MADLIIEKEEINLFVFDNDDLCVYRDDLNKAIQNNSSVLFENGGLNHAVVLLSTIFEHTQRELIIYGEQLRKELTSFDLYYYSLRECIRRGVIVRVLLNDQDEDRKSPVRKALEALSKDKESSVIVHSFPDVQSKMREVINNPTHFTVADGKMVRIEYNPEKFKAFSSMNNTELSGILRDAFYKVFPLKSQEA